MQLDWNYGPLADGLRCYRSGQYFEAHEHWEAVWLDSKEPEKTFLQSLIQITAALHHLERGNRIGARSLLGRARARLERFPGLCYGICVETLTTQVAQCLSCLDEQAPASHVSPPQIL